MRNLTMLAAGCLVALGLQTGPARAGEAPVVVELFTSQGCSSCPPADLALAQLARRNDVVALSLHVDYWDYLGWRDTFAQPQFGQRQHAYREGFGKRVVYTPQLVVQGARDVAPDQGALEGAIRAAQRSAAPVSVRLLRHDGMLYCRIEPVGPGEGGTIWIAKYALNSTVEITRGENAGRSITYANVVRSLNRMGDWSGGEIEEVAMPQPDPGEGVAVWVQARAAGPILAAAKLENPAE